MLDTLPYLLETDFPQIKREKLTTLQVNVGYICNQQCLHCHVNAGPNRSESMSMETARAVIDFAQKAGIKTLDLTGGAPEMHPVFRYLVSEAVNLGIEVIDRCNLTVLLQDEQKDTVEFLAANKVQVVASMPCYSQENVDRQRGKGVFQQSIEALKRLNARGYGQANSGLVLNLVYNPQGAFLPPGQQQLEQDYKQKLFDEYGLVFNKLLVITNLPIKRFGSMLLSKGLFEDYMNLLKDNFCRDNLVSVMCKSLISIDYLGNVYDCDFNQMLAMKTRFSDGTTANIQTLELEKLKENPIAIAEHCYGCTAGQGSSCGGALAS